jgi:hypothetical protein
LTDSEVAHAAVIAAAADLTNALTTQQVLSFGGVAISLSGLRL